MTPLADPGREQTTGRLYGQVPRPPADPPPEPWRGPPPGLPPDEPPPPPLEEPEPDEPPPVRQ